MADQFLTISGKVLLETYATDQLVPVRYNFVTLSESNFYLENFLATHTGTVGTYFRDFKFLR